MPRWPKLLFLAHDGTLLHTSTRQLLQSPPWQNTCPHPPDCLVILSPLSAWPSTNPPPVSAVEGPEDFSLIPNSGSTFGA